MKFLLLSYISCRTDVLNQIDCKVDNTDLSLYRVVKKSKGLATVLSTKVTNNGQNCANYKTLFLKAEDGFRNCTSYVEDEFFMKYRSYFEISCYLSQLAQSYKHLVSLQSIGKSNENRDLHSFSVTVDNAQNNKKIFYFNGGLHAREWISPMSVVYVLKSLLYDNKKYEQLLTRYVVMFTPLSNPDGYEFSRASKDNRLWRKNRRRNPNGSYGVDLNRNFDDNYGKVGFSTNPEDETYQGIGPNSEPETQALTSNILKYNGSIVAGIDFHSFGQSILRNYGYTTELSRNEAKLKEVSAFIQAAIKKSTGLDYYTDTAAGLYPAGGAFDDWMAQKAKMMSFTVELCPTKDDDKYKFELPESMILDCAPSALSAAVSMMNYTTIYGFLPANN